MIETNTCYNENCLDTMAKMAILNKRNWIGSEISEEYCKIIEERINIGYRELEDIKSQLTLF